MSENYEGTCYVYKFFDANGVNLYVGCSSNIPARLGAHQRSRAWWPEVARIEIDAYPNAKAGWEAEKAAIQALDPTHNSVYTSHRTPPRIICSKCRRSKHNDCLGVNREGETCPCGVCLQFGLGLHAKATA